MTDKEQLVAAHQKIQDLGRQLTKLSAALKWFRLALIDDLKQAKCPVTAIGLVDDDPNAVLTVAMGRIQALEEKIRRLEGK